MTDVQQLPAVDRDRLASSDVESGVDSQAEEYSAGRDDWQVDEADRQELRLAVAMTGGVSLAVWMGGVAAELRRFSTPSSPQQPNPYRGLCEVTGQDPSIDVISGTSAGGINGALLALATVRDADLDFLRDLWVDDGSLEQLLRSPVEPDPRSLLRGDEYFLPTLRRAFDSIPRPRTDAKSSMQLLISTTLLQGESRTSTDDFGTVLRQVDHNGTFTFRDDDFFDREISAKLARAARCSASFPGAFEASYCRVGPSEHNGTSSDHPDMTNLIDTTISRYTVDGGLVNNKPVGPALRAVFEHAPNRPVTRVLTYVVPDPGASTYGEAERADQPPTLGHVLTGSLVDIPQAQSIAADLDALRQHNRRVERQRYVREQILDLKLVETRAATEDRRARYQELRATETVDTFLDELTRQINGRLAAGSLPESWRGAYEFRAEAFQQRRATLIQAELKRSTMTTADADVFDSLPLYGPAAVQRAGGVVLSLTSRATRLCLDPSLRARRQQLIELSQKVTAALRAVPSTESARRALECRLRDALGGVEEGQVLDDWTRTQFEEWTFDVAAGTALAHAMRVLCDTLSAVREHVGHLTGWYAGREQDTAEARKQELLRLSEAVAGLTDEAHDSDETCRRLLALEVLQVVLALDRPALEQQVELLQVSAESRNGLTWHQAPSDKLTGLQLHHFGAFYRRSWRANDWLWGRFDAVGWVTYLLLAPARLRVLQEVRNIASDRAREQFVGSLMTELEDIATGKGSLSEAQTEELRLLWERDKQRIEEELSFLKTVPGCAERLSLPITSMAVARAMQYCVLLEELPKLRDDLELDVRNGASGRATAAWRARFDREWTPEVGERDARVPIRLFGSCPLPRETLADEVGSDLLTYTVATSAATGLRASGGAVPAMPGVLRPLASAARGAGVVTYVLARWALLNSKLTIGLTVGALLGGLFLLVVGSNAMVDAVGVLLLLGGVAFTWLRAGERTVRVLLSILVSGAFVVLLAGPWLWEPVRPAAWLANLADLIERHPLWYVAVVALLALIGLGRARVLWSTSRRQSLSAVLYESLAETAGDDLLLGVRVDPAIQRCETVHVPSLRKAARQFVEMARQANAHNAVLRVHQDDRGELLVLEHDGDQADRDADIHFRRWLSRRHVGRTVPREREGWTVLSVTLERQSEVRRAA